MHGPVTLTSHILHRRSISCGPVFACLDLDNISQWFHGCMDLIIGPHGSYFAGPFQVDLYLPVWTCTILVHDSMDAWTYHIDLTDLTLGEGPFQVKLHNLPVWTWFIIPWFLGCVVSCGTVWTYHLDLTDLTSEVHFKWTCICLSGPGSLVHDSLDVWTYHLDLTDLTLGEGPFQVSSEPA